MNIFKAESKSDWKSNYIYILNDNEYIYAIAITSNHPLFLKILNLCQSYKRLMGEKYKTLKIWKREKDD